MIDAEWSESHACRLRFEYVLGISTIFTISTRSSAFLVRVYPLIASETSLKNSTQLHGLVSHDIFGPKNQPCRQEKQRWLFLVHRERFGLPYRSSLETCTRISRSNECDPSRSFAFSSASFKLVFFNYWSPLFAHECVFLRDSVIEVGRPNHQ